MHLQDFEFLKSCLKLITLYVPGECLLFRVYGNISSDWLGILSLVSTLVCLMQPRSCSRAMKAVGVVEASCEAIFELVMGMDGTRFEWVIGSDELPSLFRFEQMIFVCITYTLRLVDRAIDKSFLVFSTCKSHVLIHLYAGKEVHGIWVFWQIITSVLYLKIACFGKFVCWQEVYEIWVFWQIISRVVHL